MNEYLLVDAYKFKKKTKQLFDYLITFNIITMIIYR